MVHAITFDKVVETHWSRIFHFMLGWVRNQEMAEDLTQDCFWRASRGWNQFRGDSSVYTWLRRIAMNVIKNFARDNRIQFWRRAQLLDPLTVEHWLPDRNTSVEADILLQERLRAVWQAAESLSTKQREAFLLRFAQEMDVPEIANAMGVSEGAVKVHLFRAVTTVRKRLRWETARA